MSDAPVSGLPAVASFLDALEWAVNDAGTSRKLSGAQISASWGLDTLGSTRLLSAAHETEVVTLTWPPGSGVVATHECLLILVNVASYGGSPDASGDIASLRFNGDTGANYWSRHLHYSLGAWTDNPFPSAVLIRLAESNSRLSRNVIIKVNNLANRGKTCNIKNQTGTADATVVGSVNVAGGEWVNVVDQISTVQMVNAGSNNMGANSGFTVLGMHF